MGKTTVGGIDLSPLAILIASLCMIIFLVQGSSTVVIIPIKWVLNILGFPTGSEYLIDVLYVFLILFSGLLAVGVINTIAPFFMEKRNFSYFGSSGIFIFLLSASLAILSSLWQNIYIWPEESTHKIGWYILNLFLFWYLGCCLVLEVEREKWKKKDVGEFGLRRSVRIVVFDWITKILGNPDESECITITKIRLKGGLMKIFVLFILTVLAPYLMNPLIGDNMGVVFREVKHPEEWIYLIITSVCMMAFYWILAYFFLMFDNTLKIS
jgi:hypothetical protein